MLNVSIKDNRTDKVLYSLSLISKRVVIEGDSGTGKTALATFISTIHRRDLTVVCEYQVRTITSIELFRGLDRYSKYVLIVDEDVESNSLQEILDGMNSDWYLILMCRDAEIRSLVGVHSKAILKCNNDGLISLEYSDKNTLYSSKSIDTISTVYCEDSGSALDYYQMILPESTKFATANIGTVGYKRLKTIIEDSTLQDNTLICADGETYDNIASDLHAYVNSLHVSICIFIPISFEHLLLESDIFDSLEDIDRFRKEGTAPKNYNGSSENYALSLMHMLNIFPKFIYNKEKGNLDYRFFTSTNLKRIGAQLPAILQRYTNCFSPHTNKPLLPSLQRAILANVGIKGRECNEVVKAYVECNNTCISPEVAIQEILSYKIKKISNWHSYFYNEDKKLVVCKDEGAYKEFVQDNEIPVWYRPYIMVEYSS